MAIVLFKRNEPRWNEELAAFVDEEYRRRMSERRPWELQWRLNLEFINGNQYLDINPVTQKIEEIPKLYWYQEREVFNQVAPIVETRIARLTRQEPIMRVRPASNDDADISAAKVSSMLLNSAWHDQDMGLVYHEFVTWLEACGTSFLKVTWNPNRGRVIVRDVVPDLEPDDGRPNTEGPETPKEADPLFGKSGARLVELREGDIETVVVPPFEIFPDSAWRPGLEQCRSIIHARAYHVDEIEEMWGVKIEPEEVEALTLQRSSTGLGGLGYSASGTRFATHRLKNHAVVKEYYERPSKKYPQGRFIVVAGGKTLHAGPLPYLIGQDAQPEFPFIRTVSIPAPGCFWGKSIVERLIPLQRRYNALRNRKAEYLNLVAIGQWYEPEGTLPDDTELNNAPGNRIRYIPGPNGIRPEPVQFPSLPASFEREIETLLAEFTAISGVSELSRFSEAPPGVKSGVALSIAQEQDDTRIGMTAARIAEAITKLGKYWLRLYRQFVQEPRILRTVGRDREIEVMDWNASYLRSDDVIIENSAALAESPAQRRQMVFDLLSAGLFNRPENSPLDPEMRRKVFELLEYGHWEGASEDDSALQKSRARRENRLMMQGQSVQVMDFDDHLIHIQQHNRMRMSAEYEALLRTPSGPLIDQMVRLHIAEHMQALLASQMTQQAPAEQSPPQEQKEQGGERDAV